MYKLQGHSLTRGPWFLPESQSLTLMEKGSTSTITMPMDSAVQIDFNDWLYDEDVPSSDPIVWRVKSISESNNTNTATIELEHVIKLLADQQIFGEVTTEDISGGTSCTARQAIEYLLEGNFDWQLGDLEVINSLPYEFETLSVYDAIETVTDTLEGVYWDYDLTQHPFILNIRLLEMDPDCEMREGRNLSTLKRSVSRTGMYTRIYPIGENDLHIPGDYISNNEEIYGRIDKVVTDSTKTTIENLGAWAHGLLMHNSDPDVTITISGLELSESTGEPMDRLRLNRFCRCPLPEYATTIIERITKLAWKDLIKDRESVTVTLANNMKELSEIIKTESNKAGGGSGAAGQAKQNYLFQANGEHLLYEVFDENGHLHGVLRMTSESLRVAFENLNECTRSEFRMTSESLRISFENEIRSTRSEFQMTSESLRIHFENEIASTRSEFELTSASMRIEFQNEIASTRSEFELTSASMRIEFQNEISSTRSEFEMTSESMRIEFQNEISSTRAAIQVEAGRISQIVEAVGDDGEVTAASIVLAINESEGTSEARIDANHVYIGDNKSTTIISGKLNTSDLAAEIARITTLNTLAISADGNIQCSGGMVTKSLAVNQSYGITAAGTGTFSGIKLGNYSSFSDCVTDASVSGNTLTLTKASGGTVTFSKATSLSGAWSGNKYTVTASPQGNTVSDTISMLTQGNGSTSFSVSACHTSAVAANVVATQNLYLTEDTSAKKVYARAGSSSGTAYGGISTQNTYNAGANSVTLSQGSWSNGAKTVTASNGKTETVSIPAVNSTTWTNTTGRTWRADLSIGGTTRYSSTKNFDSYYTDGIHAYYDSDYWSHSGGSVYVPNRNNTASELWFTYDTYELAARAVWGRYYDGSWHYYNGGSPIELYYAT